MLLDYQRGTSCFSSLWVASWQREAFLQLQNGTFVQTQNTTRYYISVSYRISFRSERQGRGQGSHRPARGGVGCTRHLRRPGATSSP